MPFEVIVTTKCSVATIVFGLSIFSLFRGGANSELRTFDNTANYNDSNVLDEGSFRQLNLHINGLTVNEVYVGPMDGSRSGIVVRQLSNGKQLVKLVYNGVPSYLLPLEKKSVFDSNDNYPSLLGTDEEGLELRECLVEKDSSIVNKFMESFGNGSLLKGDWSRDSISTLPKYLRAVSGFSDQKHKCFALHRAIRKLAKADRKKEERLLLRRTKNADSKSSLVFTPIRKRSARGLNELFILPGTKWCGNGRLADSYNDLDGYMVADYCCRTHDLCPSSIPRLSRKFGLYNFRLTTISHCSCDKRFKTCLKQTGSRAADVVGNVFFSIVKSSCFEFKRKKVCAKRGFWNCLKWSYEKQAVIKNPIPWNT